MSSIAPGVDVVSPSATLPARLRVLTAMQTPSFRALWLNTFAFQLLWGAQRFTFVWLVLDLGHGVAAAGLAVFTLTCPSLILTVPAGVLTDRCNQRMVLMVTQMAALGFTALAAVIMAAGAMTFPIVILLTLALGCASAIGSPVRSAILPAVVPKEHLMNAIVLNSAAMNLSWIIGPSLAGAAIALLGIGGAFASQTVVYALAAVALIGVRLAPREPAPPSRPMNDLIEGFRFVVRYRAVGLVVLMTGLANFFNQMHGTLIPKLAKDELGVSAFAASSLYMFMGSGMLVVSIYLASRTNLPRKGLIFLLSIILVGPPFILIGYAPNYALAGLWFLIWGAIIGFFVNTAQTMVQSETPGPLMGRVMSLYTFSMVGMGTLGGLAAGIYAGQFGAVGAMVTAGVLSTALGVVAFVTLPAVRRVN